MRKDKHVAVFENLSDTEGFLDDAQADGPSDAGSDSDEHIEYDMGEYRPADAFRQRGTELKLIGLKRNRADAFGHYEGESEVEEPFPVSESEDSDDFVPIATYKKQPVKKGPTSRSHGSEACTSNPDYIPSDDVHYEVAEESDDSMDTPVVLPSGRKSRAKKKKDRKSVV